MQHFRIPRQAQSIIAHTILTEYSWSLHSKSASWNFVKMSYCADTALISLADRSPSRASSTSSSQRAYHHHSTSPERRHRYYNSSTSSSRDRSHTPSASAAPSGGVGIGGEVSSSGRSSRSSMRIEDDPIERLRQRLYG